MIGIDLFSGAGGMSLGAQLAGVDVQIAVENDKHAAMTYRHNHKNCRHFFEGDIGNFVCPEIDRSQPVIVFGGPPCQGFSTSNQRDRSAENPKNWLFKEFLRVVDQVRPDWVVFENVKGITEVGKGEFVNLVKAKMVSMGYHVSISILNAKDFGVPQSRSRFFLIGSLKKTEINFQKKNGLVTVLDAISDLPDLEIGSSIKKMPYKNIGKISNYALSMRKKMNECSNHLVSRNSDLIVERYKHIPQGGNWECIPDFLMGNYQDKSRCHTGIYRRLKWNEPSVVIGNYRKNMLIHPSQDRGLSVREAARLQSFPDWFDFQGSIGFQQQQVGNAVPPLLAKAVFDAITGVCEK